MRNSIFFRFLLISTVLISGIPAKAAPLASAARTVIPAEIQQIIEVDYRRLNASPAAMALKARVMPEQLQQLESSLRGVGIRPESDIETLTFASFRMPNKTLRMVGIASGEFSTQKILLRIKKQKILPEKYRSATLYSMGGSMAMTFLDNYTLLFGEPRAVKAAIRARDGEALTLNSNSRVTDLISGVDSGTVWSVLDAEGTQNMMRSALGDASGLADYEVIKKRLLGSRYSMDFSNGVNFDMDVVTPDTFSAATLSTLFQAGILYRKTGARGVEKAALDNIVVKSDSGNMRLHFKTDDKNFETLIQSDLFAAVSR